MVRSFLLNEEQRRAVIDYFQVLPDIMPGRVRQVRYKAKKIDFNLMQSDLDLLKKLAVLSVPMGRKSEDLKAKLIIRRGGKEDLKVKFKIPEKEVE